jgi:hypothetical protein
VLHHHANDCRTILDILAHQLAAPPDDLDAVRRVIDDVLAALSTLG